MAGLHIPITATDNNVSSKLDQVARKIDELASKAQASNNTMIDSNSKLGASFNALATKVGASVAAIASVQKLNDIRQTITQVRGDFEQLEISLSTILGSKAEADKLMAQVVDFAAKTPFDMKGVASGVKQLLAYGSSADSVIDEMRMLGDIASGLSIPLGDMVYLFGTTRTQGRMFTQDLRQFMGRGIPLAEELAKQFSVTKAEVGDLVTAGKVGFNEMYQALQAMTSEGGKFYNLMDSQSRSILGMQSNADDARDKMYNEIGKLLQGVTAKGIEAQNYLYENYEKIGRVLLELVGTYGVYKAVLITINALHKAQRVVLKEAVLQKKLASMANVTLSNSEAIAAARTSLLNKSMKGLLTTLKATGKAMLSNPYVLAAAAVAGLAYGIYKLVTAKSAEEKALDATNKRWQEYNDGIEKRLNDANDLISAMKDENKSSSERVESMRKLAQQYPQLLEKYGEEALMLMDIRDLKREIVGIESTNKKSDLEEDIKTLKKLKTIYEGNGNFKTVNVGDRGHELIKELGIQQSSYSHSLEAVNKALSETQKKLNDIYKAEADAAFANKPLEERLKIYEDRAEEARKKVKELNAEIDKLGNKKPSNGNIPNFFFTGKDSATLQSERDAQIKAAEDADKNAEAIRKKQEEDKKKATAEALKAQQKAQEDINKKLLQSDNEREKAKVQQKIDLLQYSTKAEKEKDEELHNLRKEMLQIEQAIALETLDLEYKKYKAIFEAAGKDTKPLDDAFAKLEQNTVDSFKQKSDKEDAGYEKKKKDRDEQALDDMIAYNEKYGNIMERRAAIVQKYTRLIEKAENEAQKKTLANEMNRELREFDLVNSEDYAKMFVSAGSAFSGQLQEGVALLEQYIRSLIEKGVDPASEEIQMMIDKANELKDALRGRSVGDDLQKLFNAGSLEGILQIGRERDANLRRFENGEIDEEEAMKIDEKLVSEQKLQKVSVAMQAISSAIGIATDALDRFANETGDKTAKALAETFSTIQGGLQAFMQGGMIGFIMFGLSKVVEKILDAVIAARKAREAIEAVNEEFKKLSYDVKTDDFDSIFGTDKIGLAAEAWEKAQKALEDYQKVLGKTSDFGTWISQKEEKELEKLAGDNRSSWSATLAALDKGYTDLQSMSIDTGQKGANRYMNLKDLSEKEGWGIWDENGEFDYEKAQVFLEKYEGLTDEQRKQIQNAADLKKAYEEAMEVIEGVAQEIVGNLASGLADSIVEAVETGADAWDGFEKAGADAIRTLGKMMLQNLILESLFTEDREKAITAALGNKDYDGLVEIFGEIGEEVPAVIEAGTAALDAYYAKAGANGYDMSAIAEQEATAKGFQAMSQETGDELNGRFTDIQAKSGMIAIGVNSLVQINTSIFQNTSAMLLQLGEMFGIQNLQLKELNTISKNTSYLLTIYDEISTLRRNVGVINGD